MDALTQLLSQYSFGTIIIFCVVILLVIKFISELWDFFYEKLKKVFDKNYAKNNAQQETIDKINKINEGIEKLQATDRLIDERLNAMDSEISKRLDQVEISLNHTQERLQENTRNYIIDAHHKYVYQMKAIDDIMLQSLERRYMYYKTSGGDTFIDGLMDDIRALPKIQSYNPNILDAVHHCQDNDSETEFIES